jgi:pimeloyl-ACP methyl ester carboxylesterase
MFLFAAIPMYNKLLLDKEPRYMTAHLTLTLPDGRILAYQEFGDPQGLPLLFCHGMPGSRLDLLMIDPSLFAGLRIIAVDRPGIGGSTYLPGRTFLDWPADITALADALALERFRVLGISGGAPYALVTAARLPDRVELAALVSPIAPLDAPGVSRGMGPGKLFFLMARWLPFLASLQLNLMRSGLDKDPAGFLKQAGGTMPEPDQRALADERVAAGFLQSMEAALHTGVQGVRHDASLYAHPWSFRLEAIQAPVFLWHGEADRNAPVAMSRYLAERLPHSTARYYPGEGHLSAFANHALEIMAALKA